jgi:serine/threonine protein kinase
VLGSMQHRHIVALLGWCPEEHCLVYELAEKGNLEERLPQLDWVARTRIATEVCRGLVYLHLRCVRRIVAHVTPPSLTQCLCLLTLEQRRAVLADAPNARAR